MLSFSPLSRKQFGLHEQQPVCRDKFRSTTPIDVTSEKVKVTLELENTHKISLENYALMIVQLIPLFLYCRKQRNSETRKLSPCPGSFATTLADP